MTRSAVAGRLTEADCRLEDLIEVLASAPTRASTRTPRRWSTRCSVYDSARLRRSDRDEVSAELVRALADGPGVVVFRAAFPDRAVVDRATAAFE